MSSTFPIAICYINGMYPGDYWNLKDVADIKAPPELWWSSRERTAFEDGLPTAEYLELDFGRLRSLNFLNFNILQKPIDITVEYDVWGFESGIKFWQPVTRLSNERFDNLVSYSPNSVNPWKNCQFYFTNVKGDLLSTRYLRLRFDRRNEPWPNGDLANTFPWSIDVKDLRTSRYVVSLNDTRGALVQQGKVVAAIIDPVHYEDLTSTTPQVIGIPSGTDVQTVPPGHANETYINYMVSSADSGNEIPGTTGGGGATWSGLSGNASRARVRTDSNEAGHVGGDLPVSQYNYQFFTPWPSNMYGVFLAIGDAGSVGVNTTVDHTPWPEVSATGATANNTGAFGAPTPAAGELLFTFLSVRGSATATGPPVDPSGATWTLFYDFVTTGGVHSYIWYRITGSGEGPIGVTVPLSASVQHHVSSVLFSTPSSTNIYILDEGPYVQTHPSDYVAIQTASHHG